jgi:transposase-like protein
LLPPINLSVTELARQEGVSQQTLYNWRREIRAKGAAVPGNKKVPDEWPAEAKFAVVVATAGLSEIDLAEYCRSKGLYPEQVNGWRDACIAGQQTARDLKRVEQAQAKADRKRIQELEREIRRKDKALAEAAALLVLRKKLNAYWGDDSEEQ